MVWVGREREILLMLVAYVQHLCPSLVISRDFTVFHFTHENIWRAGMRVLDIPKVMSAGHLRNFELLNIIARNLVRFDFSPKFCDVFLYENTDNFD